MYVALNLLQDASHGRRTLVIRRAPSNANWWSLAAERDGFLILDRGDARALLSDPATWDPEGAGAGVMLRESDAAEGWSFDASKLDSRPHLP